MPVLDLILSLAWLLPLIPFLAFVSILLCTRRNHRLSQTLAVASAAVTFGLSQAVFWAAMLRPVGGAAQAFESILVPWFRTGSQVFSLGVYVDPATAVMLFTVPLLCLVTTVYTTSPVYARYECTHPPHPRNPGYSRLLAYISLLTATMLGMVVLDNLLTFFIFWEGLGVCVYLLAGFRREKKAAVRAGLRAFLTIKAGDLFFLLGLALTYSQVGSLSYRDVFKPQTVEALARTPFRLLTALSANAAGCTDVPMYPLGLIGPHPPHPCSAGTFWSVAAVIALLFLGAIAAMSAQFPLHAWLVGAARAPTPASALIQTTTVVPAGTFLLIRAFPIFEAAREAGLAIGGTHVTLVAFVGALTAILSSIAIVAQTDVRRALAFSTISQAGTVVAALGIGAYAAGIFHLATQSCASTLLVLGSGLVSTRMGRGAAPEHGHHRPRPLDPHDMAGMGGLRTSLPRTFWTFLVGGLLLSGFPLLTAGFWSRYGILAHAFTSAPLVFWMLAVSAGLIAFGLVRMICLTFLGQPRSTAAARASERTASTRMQGVPGTSTSLASSPSATCYSAPLVVLALLTLGLGWIGIPGSLVGLDLSRSVGLEGAIRDWFQVLAGPMISKHAPSFSWQPLAWGATFALGGLVSGWLVYGWKPRRAGELDRVEAAMRRARLGWLYSAAQDGFRCHKAYGWKPRRLTFVRGSIVLADLLHALDRRVAQEFVNLARRIGAWLSRTGAAFDLRVVDRLVNLAGRTVRAFAGLSAAVETQVTQRATDDVGEAVKAGGQFVRSIQTGRVQSHLLLACLALLALVVAFFLILFLQI